MHQLGQGNLKLLFKLVFMKFLICIFMLIVISCTSGCRTGGKWINPNSTGAKIISPNNSLSKGGAISPKEKVTIENLPLPKKEDKPKVINPTQETKNKTTAEKVNGKSFRTQPIAPSISSAEAQPFPPVEIEAAGADKGILEPSENIVNINRMNIVPKNNPPKGKVDKPIDNVIINEKMKIDWLGLFMFYFMVIIAIIITWMLLDLAKDFINKQKEDRHNPFRKKPTTKTRTRSKKSSTRVAARNKK